MHKRTVKEILRTYFQVRSIHIFANAVYLTTFAFTLRSLIGEEKAASWTLALIAFGLLSEGALEMLTGRFADVHGRYKSILLYSICFTLSSAIFLTAKISHMLVGDVAIPFYIALGALGQLLFILASCFLSGSLESWAIDSINKIENQSSARMFSISIWWEAIMWILGGSASFILREWTKSERAGAGTSATLTAAHLLPWLLIIFAMVSSLTATTLSIGEDERVSLKNRTDERTILHFLGDAWRTARANRRLFLLVIAYSGSYMLWVSIAFLWPATYELMHEKNKTAADWIFAPQYAWILFCMARLAAAAIVNIVRRANRFDGITLTASTILNVAPMVAAGWLVLQSQVGQGTLRTFLILIVLSKIGEEIVKPIRRTLLNDAIADSTYRATINSLSQAVAAFVALIAIALGVPLLLITSSALTPNHDGLRQYGAAILAVSMFSTLSLPLYMSLRNRIDIDRSKAA